MCNIHSLYVDHKDKKSILTLAAVDYLCANRYLLSVQRSRGLSGGYVDDSQGPPQEHSGTGLAARAA